MKKVYLLSKIQRKQPDKDWIRTDIFLVGNQVILQQLMISMPVQQKKPLDMNSMLLIAM